MKRARTEDRLHLELRSSFEVLDDVVAQAEEFFQDYVTDDDMLYRLVLLASEAVTNAIKHGNRLNEALKVRVWLSVAASEALVVVEDEGQGFDRERLVDPLAEDHLLDSSGRGVFLMENMADEVRWEDGGRRVLMRMNLDR